MSHKPTEKEYRQSQDAGESARRAGRPLSSCPLYASGEYGRIRAEAWRDGWERVDNSRRKAK